MTETYVPGGVANILGKSKKKDQVSPSEKKKKSKQKALEALFSKPSPSTIDTQESDPSPKKKKKKKSDVEQHETLKENQSPKKRKTSDTTSAESVSSAKKAKTKDAGKSSTADTPKTTGKPKDRAAQRENRKKKKDPEKLSRTVFVGNVPNKVEKRRLLAFFKKYGIVESVRFRSAAPADLKLPKKAMMITKAFHKDLHTMNAYVVFKKKQAAKDALAGNGEILEGNHIRVDLAKNAQKVDTKKSIFIGNLPFDTEDEQLREHFEDCGQIDAIRIIREKQTGLGKGFGYIKFEDKDGVEMALKLNSSIFRQRTLRVQRAENQTQKKKGPKQKQEGTDKAGSQVSKHQAGDKKKRSFSQNMPSNITSKDFQGVKARSIQKMKKRQKQKKKLKKQRDAGKNVIKVKKSSNKGNAARNRIAKKIKKGKPRNT